MFFGKKSNNNSNKLDKLVTGLIIGGAAASILGLSKTKKGKEITTGIKSEGKSIFNKSYSLFGKGLVKIISIFNKKK